jgi:hypothetical protein
VRRGIKCAISIRYEIKAKAKTKAKMKDAKQVGFLPPKHPNLSVRQGGGCAFRRKKFDLSTARPRLLQLNVKARHGPAQTCRCVVSNNCGGGNHPNNQDWRPGGCVAAASCPRSEVTSPSSPLIRCSRLFTYAHKRSLLLFCPKTAVAFSALP